MDEFATVLRAWRDRMRPEEAGLPAGPGRRAPGLRREELAALAGVSVEYVVRLEQGRARHPSPQLLGALARALRLTEAERDHLFRVGGAAVPGRREVPRHVTAGVQRVMDRLGDVPMAVMSASWDVLRWNPLWAAIGGDPATVPPAERNVVWKHFTEGHRRMRFDEVHEEEFARDLVADLREAVGRYPDDRPLAALIARLRAVSPDFAARWGEAHVAQHRSSRKTATDTPVGEIELDCDVLTAPGSDLRIVVYTAVPGSEAASKLDLLRVTAGPALV
ncbi:helix-turn-helix domain-containing protein [Amnibacterium endophyticum]|uniref:Helix-turn-helix domain-containing protein n=1 Tax=Amnibacterium endophyticum TaxID=2109337 RepID=A0ABW4LCV6_9MICO